MSSNIIIQDAREGNLKNISLEIPREKLTVITGVSGSGKTTLALDVLFMECQRRYLEAIGMQGIRKPKVESIRNISPAIHISQSESNRNPRSTVGTSTDIYTDLRMVYEKLAERECPNCHQIIAAADCKEETEVIDGDFYVYMYCNRCGYRMDKLTRGHYSYNTREGACPTCKGYGRQLTINQDAVLHEERSLEDGAIEPWEKWGKNYHDYIISAVYNAYRYYGLPVPQHEPLAKFSPLQRAILLDGVESQAVKEAFPDMKLPKTVAAGRYEGVFTSLWRRMSDHGGDASTVNEYFDYAPCPECHGERLAPLSRSAKVQDIRLPELGLLSLEDLRHWIEKLEGSLAPAHRNLVEAYLLDLKTKIRRLVNVGLEYLTLDRQTVTLSGGELQRIKLAAALDSDLTGIIYVMDEPTVGLHPRDTQGMISILKKLRDQGNTVIVIEHDPDVMKEADFVVDIGPGSGKHGGEVIATGTLQEIVRQPGSVTGAWLNQPHPTERKVRPGNGSFVEIAHARLHNLRDVSVRIPAGCLTSVSGVSGSGKSTLIFDILADPAAPRRSAENAVRGLDRFDQVVTIEQAAITRMKRSNVATYSEVYTHIRKIFSTLPDAREKGLTDKHFSFNTPGGRCENCQGLGYVTSNMLFFENQDVVCPVCGGNQFNDQVLSVQYHGHSIKGILLLNVEEALELFSGHAQIRRILSLLQDVGLGYLELGQTLTTLSGGEGQRLKLAKELINSHGKNTLYLMDEPTVGLHPLDVENFLVLLNRMVDDGNTVVVVEHNQQVIRASDWVVDLGPEGGNKGGQVVFTGTPADLARSPVSFTAKYLGQA